MKLNLRTLTLGGPHPSEGWSKALKMKRLAWEEPHRSSQADTWAPLVVEQSLFMTSETIPGLRAVWIKQPKTHSLAGVVFLPNIQKMLWPLYFLSFSFLLDIFLFKFLPFIHFDDESLHAYYRDSGICWKVRERGKMKNDLNSTSQRQPALLWYITPEKYMWLRSSCMLNFTFFLSRLSLD